MKLSDIDEGQYSESNPTQEDMVDYARSQAGPEDGRNDLILKLSQKNTSQIKLKKPNMWRREAMWGIIPQF